jgi:hypothetical protein
VATCAGWWPAGHSLELSSAIHFAANDQGIRSLTVDVRAESVLLDVEDDRGQHSITHGLGHWIRQHTGVSVWRLHHSYRDDAALILAGAQWRSPDVLELTWHFLEAPFIDRLVLSFSDNEIRLEREVNVNSGPTGDRIH